MADYNKVGLLVLRGDEILLCRKHTLTSKLILPGGCIEAGETAEQCLRREIREELGDAVSLGAVDFVGTYLDRAASDDAAVHRTFEIRLYRVEIAGEPVPSSEIAELVWFGPASDPNHLSPILVNKILPDLVARGILEGEAWKW